MGQKDREARRGPPKNRKNRHSVRARPQKNCRWPQTPASGLFILLIVTRRGATKQNHQFSHGKTAFFEKKWWPPGARKTRKQGQELGIFWFHCLPHPFFPQLPPNNRVPIQGFIQLSLLWSHDPARTILCVRSASLVYR